LHLQFVAVLGVGVGDPKLKARLLQTAELHSSQRPDTLLRLHAQEE